MKARVLCAALAGMLSLSAVTLGAAPVTAEPLAIHADSYPVAYFAGRIAGDAAQVVLPVPDDRDPEFWTPSIAEIAAYQDADLILLNGADLARWTTRVTLPRAHTVDTSAVFSDSFIATETLTHNHGPEGAHSHTGTAAFTWLDLDQAARQAEVVADAVSARRPDQSSVFHANLGALKADLAALDAGALQLGALARGRPLLATHPRYHYFARRYGLAVEYVAWGTAQPPSAEDIAVLEAHLAEGGAPVMLWEARPDAETVDALTRRNFAIVVFPTLARPPDAGDFTTSIRASLGQLRDALAGL